MTNDLILRAKDYLEKTEDIAELKGLISVQYLTSTARALIEGLLGMVDPEMKLRKDNNLEEITLEQLLNDFENKRKISCLPPYDFAVLTEDFGFFHSSELRVHPIIGVHAWIEGGPLWCKISASKVFKVTPKKDNPND